MRNTSNTKNAPLCDVRGGEEDVKHIEHAPKGVLDVLDVRGGMRNTSNTKNTPLCDVRGGEEDVKH